MEKMKYPLDTVLARNLVKIRERSGMSREKLARYSGTTEKTIIEIEHEIYIPSLEILVRIARALRCTIHELVPVEEVE